MRKVLKVVGVVAGVFAALGALIWLTTRNEDERFFDDDYYDDDDYFEDDLDDDEPETEDVTHGYAE